MNSRMIKTLSSVLAAGMLAACLSGCAKTPAAAPTDTPEAVQTTDAPVVQATDAPDAAGSQQTAFVTPCIDAPYDHSYQDETRQIVVRRFEAGDIIYYVADVQLTDPSQLRTALSGDKPNGSLEPLSEIANRCGAILAINADDYGVHEYGTIIRNGELIRTHDTTRNMLIVDKNGDFSVRIDRKDEDPEALGQSLVEAETWQTFEFGPVLVQDGQAVDPSPAFDLISTNPKRREPRTAIGQIGPLHYVLIVADGRNTEHSKGMTLGEMQRLMLEMGAKTAMNLDGGGSSEMWFMGEIISQPSQGRERSISDILFF